MLCTLKHSWKLLVLIVFVSCESDFITTDRTTEFPIPTRTVISDFDGFVKDVNGDVLEAAIISFGNELVLSDENGYFKIEGKTAIDKAYIKVSKEGYFDAYGVLIPSADQTGYVVFALQPKDLVATISAENEHIVHIDSDNGQIHISPNSFNSENGDLYMGDISVYASYIDPTASNFNEIMPGGLFGIDVTQEEVGLISFGMINAEFYGSNGESLQLNQAANLTIRVPENLLSIAPNDIPLWYFDDEKGIWIEEGLATLSNSSYSGQVEHFTPWNCDIPQNFIQINGTIESNGTVFQLDVTFLDEISNNVFNAYSATTNESGHFAIWLPTNEMFLVEIRGPCNEIINREIGPFIENTDVVLSYISQLELPRIAGQILNCDGLPASQAYVFINMNNGQSISRTTDNDGRYNFLVPFCPADQIKISAYDPENQKLSESMIINLDYMIEANEIPDITACGAQFENSVSFNFNGEKLKFDCQVIGGPPGAKPRWFFKFVDRYNGGEIEYIYSFIEWATEDISYGWDIDKIKEVEDGRRFILGTSDPSEKIEIVLFNTEAGSPVEIHLINSAAKDEVSGIVTPTDIIFKGIIQ